MKEFMKYISKGSIFVLIRNLVSKLGSVNCKRVSYEIQVCLWNLKKLSCIIMLHLYYNHLAKWKLNFLNKVNDEGN